MDVDQPLNPGPIVSLNEKSMFVVSPYSHADIYKQIEVRKQVDPTYF